MPSVERETLETDVLLVGAGPASLACAHRLAELAKASGRTVDILCVEKGAQVGQHILSGAVMDPRGMAELIGPRWLEEGCPVEAPVAAEAVYHLTRRRKLRYPFLPGILHNAGFHVVTLSHVTRWLRERVEALGVHVLEGFPASDLLWDEAGRRVIGARTVDQGVRRDGSPGASFQPGTDIRARVTVLGEGTRGSLTRALVERLGTRGRNPQVYGTGIKEVWELPEGRIEPGAVYHTTGWPLPSRHYGGGWVYGLPGSRASIGFVPSLDSGDPRFDPWRAAQAWKTHPWIRSLLEGGKVIQAGAKTVPEGGYWSQPRLHGDGYLIVGDAGSFLNAPRLKGIHTALKSGMLAAEAIHDALAAGSFDAAALAGYEARYRASWLHEELWRVRNVRQAFQGSFWRGAIHAGLLLAVGGRLGADPIPIRADWESMERRAKAGEERPDARPDGALTFDKATGVYHSGAVHGEDQPSHLIVAERDLCGTRCREEYGNPCVRFCPADVYEMVSDPSRPATADGSPALRLEIHHANCVHCKTCDILDPYQVITWTVPPDAGGPSYIGM